MFQLKFNDSFNNTIMDIPYWKTEDDIPKNIKEFIQNTSDHRVFYDDTIGKFYCAKCLNQLDENNYCKVCNYRHKKFDADSLYYDKNVNIQDNFIATDKYSLGHICTYYVYDIVNYNVWLYCINEEVTYNSTFSGNLYKSSKLYVDTSKSYFIEKDGITKLDTNTYISFKLLDDYSKVYESKMKDDYNNFLKKSNYDDIYRVCYDFSTMPVTAYLYTDNLSKLKETIYQYSRIWELSDVLKEANSFCDRDFIDPLVNPQFEYLVNYKLYNLAWYSSSYFNSGKNFKEIFGIDKNYLPFMAKNNIDIDEFEMLKLNPTFDINLLKELVKWFNYDLEFIKKLVKDYKVNLVTLMNYLKKQKLSYYQTPDYFDYIKMAKQFNIDLTDKKYLYPNNFRNAHDNLFEQIQILKNPYINDKIQNLAKILSINNYEDDTYVIYPAASITDLIDESSQQSNCVRIYSEMIANGECQIYFMRKKDNINKSLVTIEVRNCKIVQARIKYNELPTNEENVALKKWETTLTPLLIND